AAERGFGGMIEKFRRRHKEPRDHFPLGRAHSFTTTATPDPSRHANNNVKSNVVSFGNLPKPSDQHVEHVIGGPTPPPPVISPVSRADTTSAASTVYVVQHNPVSQVPQPVRRRADVDGNNPEHLAQVRRQSAAADPEKDKVHDNTHLHRTRGQGMWHNVSNPFKRKRASPPAEVQQARQAASGNDVRAATPAHNFSRWDVKNRLGVLAAETGERFREQSARRKQDVDVPITVIPAQPRGSGRTWTPPATTQLSDVQASGGLESSESSPEHQSSGSTTLTANSIPPPTLDLALEIARDGSGPTQAGGTDS
ncbi:MAG: hypothetical protein Q9224_007689, partial [Gallowayella concinna]